MRNICFKGFAGYCKPDLVIAAKIVSEEVNGNGPQKTPLPQLQQAKAHFQISEDVIERAKNAV